MFLLLLKGAFALPVHADQPAPNEAPSADGTRNNQTFTTTTTTTTTLTTSTTVKPVLPNPGDACASRFGPAAARLNGNLELGRGEYKGYPWWDTGEGYFLYRDDTGWRFGGQFGSPAAVARCMTAEPVESVLECNAFWQVEGAPAIDTDAAISAGPCSSTTTSTTLPGPSGICGDSNNDFRISPLDAFTTLRAAVGLFECSLCICDADADGVNTVGDALRALQFGVGQPASLNCPQGCDETGGSDDP